MCVCVCVCVRETEVLAADLKRVTELDMAVASTVIPWKLFHSGAWHHGRSLAQANQDTEPIFSMHASADYLVHATYVHLPGSFNKNTFMFQTNQYVLCCASTVINQDQI